MRRYAIEESAGLSYFTWDTNGVDLLCERDAGGNLTADYVHGYAPVDGIGSMTAAKKPVGETTYYQYPVYDHRGTVMRLVDDSAAVTAYYEYDAWGLPVRQGAPEACNRFGYQSSWFVLDDSGKKLLLSPTRTYGASEGRFLNRDPLRHGLAGNAYGYVQENPLSGVDPYGLRMWLGSGELGGLSHYLLLSIANDIVGNWSPVAGYIGDRMPLLDRARLYCGQGIVNDKLVALVGDIGRIVMKTPIDVVRFLYGKEIEEIVKKLLKEYKEALEEELERKLKELQERIQIVQQEGSPDDGCNCTIVFAYDSETAGIVGSIYGKVGRGVSSGGNTDCYCPEAFTYRFRGHANVKDTGWWIFKHWEVTGASVTAVW